MKRTRLLLVLLCAAAAAVVYDRMNQPATAGVVAHLKDPKGVTSLVLLSDSYRIDRILESMQGPYSSHSGIKLGYGTEPELLWVTGVGTEVVSKSGKKNISSEYFCHANLSLDPQGTTPEAHNESFRTSLDWRLFTLVPGRMSINLPEGFGIPISSEEKLDLVSMSLNLNDQNPNFDLRFKSKINYLRDADAATEMKPLFMRGLYVLVPIGTETNILPDAVCAAPTSTNTQAELQSRIASQGMACAPPSMNASDGGKRGTNTLHWMVPPGRHTYAFDVSDQLRLNFNTTLHYATGHLHPLGEMLALRNKTTGETILEIRSKDYADKRGVEQMQEFSFPEGLKINKDHAYELVTTYNNPTQKPTDVMAIVYMYLLDRNFDRTAALSPQHPNSPVTKVASNDSSM